MKIDVMLDYISFQMVNDVHSRKGLCEIIQALLEYGDKYNCYEVVVDKMKQSLEMLYDVHYKVVDFEYNITIYDNTLAHYKYLHTILSASDRKQVIKDLVRYSQTGYAKSESYCTDKQLLDGIDIVGYSRFLSCSALDDLFTSILVMHTQNIESEVDCCLYGTDTLNLDIIMYHNKGETDFTKHVVKAFGSLFVQLFKQFEITSILHNHANKTIEAMFIEYCYNKYGLITEKDTLLYSSYYHEIKRIIEEEM